MNSRAKPDGGPAFPFPAYTYSNGEINPGEGGMALRDYFAAKALQGLLADTNIQGTPEEFATRAYALAGAMLDARK